MLNTLAPRHPAEGHDARWLLRVAVQEPAFDPMTLFTDEMLATMSPGPHRV